MRVQFLGTGGYHPNERRHTACVMLPEIGLVFDAGTSFFRVQPRLETQEVDIFLSHAHLDHIAGLTFFLVPLLQGPIRKARVHANRQTLDAVRQHLFEKTVFPVYASYEYHELTAPISVGQGGKLTFQPLPSHPSGSMGYRIDWPAAPGRPARSFAYITDTVVDGTYTEFIRGVDVLVHECYFPDELAEWGPKTGHSHTTPVVELAREPQVRELRIVHIDPQRPDDDPIDIAKARSIFPNTAVAEDLTELSLW